MILEGKIAAVTGGWTMEKMLELFPQTLGTMNLKNL